MLQEIREHAQGWIAWVILALIAFTFIFWGVGSYTSRQKSAEVVAEVNGEEISKELFDSQLATVEQRNPDVDSERLKTDVLQGLVNSALLKQNAEKMDFFYGKPQIEEAIAKIPAFQIEGKFSEDLFLSRLRQANLSRQTFFDGVHSDLIVSQYQTTLKNSIYVSKQDAEYLQGLSTESRELNTVLINPLLFQREVLVTYDKGKTYYDEHPKEFIQPEQITLDFVRLDKKSLEPSIQVSADEVKKFYEDNKTSFTIPEQVRVAHILLTFPPSLSEKEKKEYEDKMADILDQLKKGKKFDALAKQYSNDPGSKDKGGEVGWISRGEMDKDFEEAAFALKKDGDVSSVIKSKYGIHIIKRLEYHKEQQKALAEATPQITMTLKQEKLDDLFAQKQEELATAAFESPNNLELASQKLNLPIQHVGPFERNNKEGFLSNPKIAKAVYSPNVYQDKYNSDVIDEGNDQRIVLRIQHLEPEKPMELEAAISQARQKILHDKVLDKALEYADKLMKASEKGDDAVKALLKEKQLQWKVTKIDRQTSELGRDYLEFLYTIPYHGVKLPYYAFKTVNDGVLFARLDKVNSNKELKEERTPTIPATSELQDTLRTANSELETQTFLSNFKKDSKIKIEVDAD